ncbi:MAG: biosynthetic arginine decarboxylase [Pseudomonadales bacterium]
MTNWSTTDAESLYAVGTWGDSFFHVNEKGHVAVRPQGASELSVDVMDVIDEAIRENLTLPLILRFQDVLRTRVRRLNLAFRQAIADAAYEGDYRSIYPIKVNQLHEVVAEVIEAGREFNLGLECGSKTELVATLPLVSDNMLLLCNGVKDQTMLELMLRAQSIGQSVLPVIEKYSEFEHALHLAETLGVVPRLGVRVKLSTRGSGRWFESGGVGSKFGLTTPELMRLVTVLESRGMGDSLELLHFHLGSQIADIRVLRNAVREICHIYADFQVRGLSVRFVDVGGGLGVNYGGDYGDADSSVNYSLAEYANAVVYAVKEICDERGVKPPTLLSESGRAITAHHSMLVVPVLGVHRQDAQPLAATTENTPPVVLHLREALQEVENDASSVPLLLEIYHDAQEARAQADQLARLGYLNVECLAEADALYWHVSRTILHKLKAANLSPMPMEQQQLEERLTDLYLGDFSVFHSILDHWSIGQLFPVMPLPRLDEEPVRRGVVVDLTCDSDGKISRYVRESSTSHWLPLHVFTPGEPYYLGIFLVGAYQEILGDSHNLFGRVNEVHVYASPDESGNFWIEEQIRGISVKDMLAQVQYFPNDLDRRMSELVRRKIDSGLIRPNEGMRLLNFYTRMFEGSTYCDAV